MSERWSTKYGELEGVTSFSTYSGGGLKSCMLGQSNRLETPVGAILPQYRTAVFGERQKKHRSSIDFFENGQIKSVALDEQMPIATPLGTVGAELVTFYQDGSVNRIFPLNGKVDGFWSEANERQMAEPFEFDTPVGSFRAKVISFHFYPNGSLKAVALWPGEKLRVETPLGGVECRAGFSLYEDGSVRSVEPWQPVDVPTPIGWIKVFDPDIIGMHADRGSIQFHPDGTLAAVKTIHSGVRVSGAVGGGQVFEPREIPSYIDPSRMATLPMNLEFSHASVRIDAGEPCEVPLSGAEISIFEREKVLRDTCNDCPGDDSCCQVGGSCGGCSSE